MPTQRTQKVMALIGVGLLAIGLIAFELARTAPVRDSLGTLAELIGAANRGDLGQVRALCSREYLRGGGPTPAPEGGIVGLPRSIDKNYRAWAEGGDVLICPTGRIGPVYRFVREGDRRRFDGTAGFLGPSTMVGP